MSYYGPLATFLTLSANVLSTAGELLTPKAPEMVNAMSTTYCNPSDLICDLTGQSQLSFLNGLFEKAEQNTGLCAGIFIGTTAICCALLYKRYQQTPYDLIKNLITKEFGSSPLSLEIYSATEKLIKEYVDEQFKEMLEKVSGNLVNYLSKTEADNLKNKLAKQTLKIVIERLPEFLQSNKQELQVHASSFVVKKSIPSVYVPGTQEGLIGSAIKLAAGVAIKKIIKNKLVDKKPTTVPAKPLLTLPIKLPTLTVSIKKS